jgi:hypothetical protein
MHLNVLNLHYYKILLYQYVILLNFYLFSQFLKNINYIILNNIDYSK